MNHTNRLQEHIPDNSIFSPVEGGFRRDMLCLITRLPMWMTPVEVVHNGKVLPEFSLTADSTFVSNVELDEIHPHLSQGIALIDSRALATCGRIRKMLKVWQAAAHVVTTDQKLVALNDIKNVNFVSGRVRVTAAKDEYILVASKQTGELLMMPDGPHNHPYANISIEWLDTEFPGWKERFESARLLDLSLDDAMRAMCQPLLVNQDVTVPGDLSM